LQKVRIQDLTPTLRSLAAVGAIVFAIFGYIYVTLPDVRPLVREHPRSTAFMRLRAREAAAAKRSWHPVQEWVPYARMSANLRRAVLAAEDDAFFAHDGIDMAQIRQSIEMDLTRGRAIRGGSTITQQLAKNLYLSPSRNPLRKLRELLIARRLEAELSKTRILELYLNVIEWGDGIWGAEAASRSYFQTPAASLSREQAALLAGAIVNPRVLNPRHPTGRLLRRQRIILARMGHIEAPPVESASNVQKDADAGAMPSGTSASATDATVEEIDRPSDELRVEKNPAVASP
jgi:monofunctional biosynthetic peptidoglycan transglycosylase